MNDALEKKMHLAHARALKGLGRGCVASMKKRLGKSSDPDDRALGGNGITYVPRFIKRICELNPQRIVIGAESNRKRHFLASTLVGSPFRVTLTTRRGRFDVMAQRNTKTKHVNWEIASSPQHITGTRIVYQSHQSFQGYRNTALPITIISPLKLNEKQVTRFKLLTKEYVSLNHEKILSREMQKVFKRQD